MSGSSESLEFIGRGRSPQRGKEASFYDAKRVERCFFSRGGGHRPEEEWAFYWQKKPPFSGPSGDPEKVMPKSPQRPTPSRSMKYRIPALREFGEIGYVLYQPSKRPNKLFDTRQRCYCMFHGSYNPFTNIHANAPQAHVVLTGVSGCPSHKSHKLGHRTSIQSFVTDAPLTRPTGQRRPR